MLNNLKFAAVAMMLTAAPAAAELEISLYTGVQNAERSAMPQTSATRMAPTIRLGGGRFLIRVPPAIGGR